MDTLDSTTIGEHMDTYSTIYNSLTEVKERYMRYEMLMQRRASSVASGELVAVRGPLGIEYRLAT